MKVEFEPEQEALRQAVRRVFEKHLGPERLRQLWDSETGRDEELWGRLAEIGLPALLIPSEHGGLDADELDMFLALEEAGRAALPDAVVESWLLAPALLGGAGDADLAGLWLPRLAAGTARATVVFDGGTLAADAHLSDLVLVESGGQVVAYERADLVLTPVASMTPGQRLFRIVPQEGAGVVIGSGGLALARSRRAVGSAALLGGLSAYLIERAVEYAMVREQFGRIIGSFQAVKHMLAGAASLNALARHASVAATFEVARRRADHGDAATLAHVCAIDAARESNRVCLQVHGGIGFTWEHDLQIWLKHGKSLELAYGSRREAAWAAGQQALAARSCERCETLPSRRTSATPVP
ncbi:acyl-CoA dehydrogenase family protein [Amycolatopsis sp. NPDC006131]|uniref:acyl-CoA dehydrogenase family protein n=1 Tax=Amycolatopsis sp. NPDC006131 TaxID=3156731 RepID=UPI0033BF04C5